ncbi:hypothetical protein OWV82_003892 [Melia azedarach]|uniref:Uncharacterized protein n=1 Tax=Melia azedarach TaxID=155640 RepID=A0ACC1YNA9_MELAZ|nr:hypothetical protein OWV82_003892 [Melia azedarach]
MIMLIAGASSPLSLSRASMEASTFTRSLLSDSKSISITSTNKWEISIPTSMAPPFIDSVSRFSCFLKPLTLNSRNFRNRPIVTTTQLSSIKKQLLDPTSSASRVVNSFTISIDQAMLKTFKEY